MNVNSNAHLILPISTLSAAIYFYIILSSIRKSGFGILLLITLSWQIIGLCAYPIIAYSGLSDYNFQTTYLISSTNFGVTASVHVLFIAIGMLISQITGPSNFITNCIKPFININDIKIESALKFLTLFGVFCYSLYFYLVGFDVAIINAAAARGGDFEGFGDNAKYFFLKTVGSSTLLGGGLLLFLLEFKKWRYVILYIVIVIAAYINSISRTLWLATFIAPIAVHFFSRNNLNTNTSNSKRVIIAISIGLLGVLVAQYGKIFGHFAKAIFDPTSGDYDIIAQGESSNVIMNIIANYNFMFESINSGIMYFLKNGPLLSREPFLAFFFGWIPSGLLAAIGLSDFYYGNIPAEVKISCINTIDFSADPCSVPPLATGYSAYILPIGGGFIYGIIFGKLFSTFGSFWKNLEQSDPGKLWVLFFLFSSIINITTMIPSTIGYTVFSIIVVNIIIYWAQINK